MVSILPIPGGFFALANRNLNPSLVVGFLTVLILLRDLLLAGPTGSRSPNNNFVLLTKIDL